MGRCGTGVHSLCKKGYRLILQPATGDSPCVLALSLGSSLVVNGVDMVLLWEDHLSVHRFWFTLMELNNCTIWSVDGVEAETDRGAVRTPCDISSATKLTDGCSRLRKGCVVRDCNHGLLQGR